MPHVPSQRQALIRATVAAYDQKQITYDEAEAVLLSIGYTKRDARNLLLLPNSPART